MTNTRLMRKPIRATDPEIVSLIRELDRLNLPYSKLGDQIGYDRHTLSGWRRGKHGMSPFAKTNVRDYLLKKE